MKVQSRFIVLPLFRVSSKLNPTKAAGPNNITPRVLKELAPFIAPILTVIFKISYESGTIPAIWKTANICPVFKKGKPAKRLTFDVIPSGMSFI
jgi:hypothetical protein